MKKSNVKILAIESSCDETAAAVVEDGRKVLSNVISSQIDLHTIYGGVVPEIASRKHIENIKLFGVPVVVTLNHFVSDTKAEIDFIREFCESRNCEFAISKVWEEGGKGGIELADKILYTLENKESEFRYLYPDEMSLEDKLYTIATKIYGAKNVIYSPSAKKDLERAKALGFDRFPVCVAKNQYSLSDDPKKLGRPENFDINVREVYVNAGAGFVVAITGNIMTMPGLPKTPAAEAVDVDENGNIVGLF